MVDFRVSDFLNHTRYASGNPVYPFVQHKLLVSIQDLLDIIRWPVIDQTSSGSCCRPLMHICKSEFSYLSLSMYKKQEHGLNMSIQIC